MGSDPNHPVKRELWRLLAGVGLCAALVLAAYLLMAEQLERTQHTQERFHAPALRMAAELSGALASMAAPRGVAASAVDLLDDEVSFVANVTRDFGRAQALLASLIALHQAEAAPEFASTQSRLQRAAAELRALDSRYQGEPLALARVVSLRPVYASVVVQQAWRLHEDAVRRLEAQQAGSRRLFVGGFVLVCVALGLGLAVQLRRSLRGIDGILAREREARERVTGVLAAVPDLWFVLDAEGRFIEVSNPSHADLATPWNALQGQPFQLVPAALDPPGAAVDLADASRRAQLLEYAVAADAKGPRAFEARLVPLADGHWLYLSRDISESRREALALTRSREELEQQVTLRTQQLMIARDAAEEANRAKSDFLSRMSHELRTPMNAVLGFAQLLGLDTSLSQQHRQALDHILRAGKHLLHLINDVLDLAHVESGRMTLSPEPLRVADIVTEVVALMGPLAQSHRVRIDVQPMTGTVVRGDRLRVKQVLLNLVSNAVKYNRPGGWVRLQATAGPFDRVCIVVEDSGQGISGAGMAKLFEPFSRLGAEQGSIEGTGIGLSICKRLVEMMDGRIGVTSQPGQGSRFWFELPDDRLAPPPAVGVTQPGDLDGGAPARGACVLYVEDNPDNLELVMRIVERHPGVRLISAPSVALGLDLARSHRPDLILLDLHLPDASGYSLLERLRANDATASIPVVAVTANAMPGEEARALAAGFTAYVSKPLDVRKFDNLLRQLLGRTA